MCVAGARRQNLSDEVNHREPEPPRIVIIEEMNYRESECSRAKIVEQVNQRECNRRENESPRM